MSIGFACWLASVEFGVEFGIGSVHLLKRSNSLSNSHIQITSLAAVDRAMYSTCIEKVATEGCLHVCQDMVPWLMAKKYPIIEHQSLVSFPQSALHAPERMT